MSMMLCDDCGRLVDNDYDLEGVWIETGTGYICSSCVQKRTDAEAAEEGLDGNQGSA